jgi:enamine deaminase RidA (YjgF/YER057c/UK114 family)
MSHLQYHAYEKTGALKAARFGYTQSVRVENMIYISGQGRFLPQEILLDEAKRFFFLSNVGIGGWSMEDPDVWAKDQCEQVDWAFANIEKALREASAKFEHVFKVISYHKPLKPDSLERSVSTYVSKRFVSAETGLRWSSNHVGW